MDDQDVLDRWLDADASEGDYSVQVAARRGVFEPTCEEED